MERGLGVVLSAPQGATLGSPATAVVTIIDDDAATLAAIPTASEWGLLLLSMALALGGAIAMRR